MQIALLGGHYLKKLCHNDTVWTCDLPLTIQPQADNSIQRLLADHCPFHPDVLLFGDQGCMPMLTGIEELSIPTAAYLIDTHLSYAWHRYFAGMFDLVFVAQQDAAKSLQRLYHQCCWLPLFSRYGDLRQDCPKSMDVVFVGTVDEKRNPDRVRFLKAFAEQAPLEILSGAYQAPFNRARIVLNQSVRSDINFRVFEAMATGSMLLTDDVGNGLHELFEDGRQLVTYQKGDVRDAVAKARYFLEHPWEREQIAAAGRALVLERHTLEVRCTQLLSQLRQLQQQSGVMGKYEMQQRNYRKKRAAGQAYLSIALLMDDLLLLKGGGDYRMLSDWYLNLADQQFRQLLAMEAADKALLGELALLSFLKGDLQKAANYNRIVLIDEPEDCEQLLLGCRIACRRDDTAGLQNLYGRAEYRIRQELLQSDDRLWCEHLAVNASMVKKIIATRCAGVF